MKKNIIIGIITVLLIATVCFTTFAVWDNTKASIDFDTFQGASNVKLKVETTKFESNQKKLVPDGASKSSDEATIVKLATFKLLLSTDGADNNDQLKAKVVLSIGSINITSNKSDFASSNLVVEILEVDAANGTTLIPGDTTKYKVVETSTDLKSIELKADTVYTVSIQFKPSFKDSTYVKTAINTNININCVGRITKK